MTEATVEKIAQLLHREACEAIDARPDVKDRFRDHGNAWQDLEEWRRQIYRHVARKVLKALSK